MSWRSAKSLDTILAQVNEKYPGRSKASDGGIGNAEHASRASDHNPYIKDSKGIGVFTARDITHDPAHGLDARKLAESLVASKDPRIKYVISNGQICSSKQQPWVWRKYTGANGHFHHVHISVNVDPSLYDDARPWNLDGATVSEMPTQPPIPRQLELGNKGDDVKALQVALKITADGDFGAKTLAAVKGFQLTNGLRPDGIVGPATRQALGI